MIVKACWRTQSTDPVSYRRGIWKDELVAVHPALQSSLVVLRRKIVAEIQ